MEGILATEEEHAEELVSLLLNCNPNRYVAEEGSQVDAVPS